MVRKWLCAGYLLMTHFPLRRATKIGPFVAANGDVECPKCQGACAQRHNHTSWWPIEKKWELTYRCATCQEDYVLIAYEAPLIAEPV